MLEIDIQVDSIILVEQNAELAKHGIVFEIGSQSLEGGAPGLMDNDHVGKAYFGI